MQSGYAQETDTDKPSFIPPFDFPIIFSGNFGEIRANHFHGGLDFKTGGAIGKPVRALADGYISRIRVTHGSGYVLDVPVAGSLFWLIVVSLLFIFVSLALGLLISSVTRTQVAAMLASGLILMMPTMLLSGMIFPIESMPLLLQGISAVLPARWYIQAVRKLMIEGVDISLVLTEVSILAVMAVALITISFKKFKNRLE